MPRSSFSLLAYNIPPNVPQGVILVLKEEHVGDPPVFNTEAETRPEKESGEIKIID